MSNSGTATLTSNNGGDAPLLFKRSDVESLVTDNPPHVLISGAGLAGLLLGNLLEKADIPYEIFERSSEIKPLGAVMSLSPCILPVFEQLGILDELMKVSKPIKDFKIFNGELKKIGFTVNEGEEDYVGYNRIVFARPLLYDILFKRIPSHKIHMSKKVTSLLQNKHGVMIRTSDEGTHHGDILVGADGAHSGVRQFLYKTLDKEGKLPPSDLRAMQKGYICIVGTTDPLDPEKYPGMDDRFTHAYLMISDTSPHNWSAFTVPGHKICWNAVVQLSTKESEDEQFRNSEWGPEMNEKMIKQVYDFKTPYGKLGDLIDQTPRERISRVFLEDILYETWNHGRTVLIGDSAHKLLPAAGQGAINAMQDAVILANAIYDLKPLSYEGIVDALKEYREQRYSYLQTQYDASKMTAKIFYGHGWAEKMLRSVVFNLPNWVMKSTLTKEMAYRPQCTFLPLIPDRGTLPSVPHKPSKRYTEEQAQAQSTTASTI
ncbi:hypothetical protein BGX33_008916 [Mortierella sp. NVP41]|nr:hypothetical protein BGX33_008916 [Mortierella sp. NVP41]